APQLAKKIAELTGSLRLGNGLDPETQVGPLIDERGFRKVEEHVKDAVARGGTVLAGGKPFATPPPSNGSANGNGAANDVNGASGANGQDGHAALNGWFYQP